MSLAASHSFFQFFRFSFLVLGFQVLPVRVAIQLVIGAPLLAKQQLLRLKLIGLVLYRYSSSQLSLVK